MSLRSTYRKAIKKYTPDEILVMYRNNKIELNSHEWKHLHRKIDKEHLIIHGIELTSIIAAIICLIIIFIIARNMGMTYQEKVVKCNNEKNHVCTEYEIEEMFKDGNNNR